MVSLTLHCEMKNMTLNMLIQEFLKKELSMVSPSITRGEKGVDLLYEEGIVYIYIYIYIYV